VNTATEHAPVVSGRQRLAPEERRSAIVEAVVTLLAARGPAVTSAEIADAAGIAQGTIFHAFADKQALIDAVVLHVMDVDGLVGSLEVLADVVPLEDRLVSCAALVIAHLERMIPTVMKCGSPAGLDAANHPGVKLQRVIARLMDPDAAMLAHPPAQLAAVFFGLCVASAQQVALGETPTMPSPAELVALFLDGARIRESH
jgi:AcrR family transcriptional regulator